VYPDFSNSQARVDEIPKFGENPNFLRDKTVSFGIE